MEPNKKEFELVCKRLKDGIPLNLLDIYKIFGQSFFELITLCLIDAKYSMLPEEIKKARRGI